MTEMPSSRHMRTAAVTMTWRAGVRVDAADEFPVELDQIGLETRKQVQAGITCTEIIGCTVRGDTPRWAES